MKRPARPGETWGELEALILTPGEKAPHDAGVGAAGVRIGDPGGEELIGGEQGIGAGTLEDSRNRSVRIQGLGGGQQGSLGRGAVHGDLGNDNYLYRHPSTNRSQTLRIGLLEQHLRGFSVQESRRPSRLGGLMESPLSGPIYGVQLSSLLSCSISNHCPK